MARSLDAVMTLGSRLALSQSWWMWHDPPIRLALNRVRFKTWMPIVSRALQRNAEEGKMPASFRDLYKPLYRSNRSIERIREGKHALTDQLALGMSFALNVPVCQLIPDADEWIARTACELCPRGLVSIDARLYVAYLRAGPRWSMSSLDPAAVRKAMKNGVSPVKTTSEAESTILRVARTLGEVLERFSGGRLS